MEIIPPKDYIEEITRIFRFSQEKIDFHILVRVTNVGIEFKYDLLVVVVFCCRGYLL